jgi:hypothetical protein
MLSQKLFKKFLIKNVCECQLYKNVILQKSCEEIFIGIFVNMHPEPILTTRERFEL